MTIDQKQRNRKERKELARRLQSEDPSLDQACCANHRKLRTRARVPCPRASSDLFRWSLLE